MLVEISLLFILDVFQIGVPLRWEQNFEVGLFIEGNGFGVLIFQLSGASEALHDVFVMDSSYGYLVFRHIVSF